MSKDTETFRGWIPATENKKADVAEHPKAFDHVGLLFDEPPRQAGAVLHLVIRRTYV
jgi:hypothetical protein